MILVVLNNYTVYGNNIYLKNKKNLKNYKKFWNKILNNRRKVNEWWITKLTENTTNKKINKKNTKLRIVEKG